MHSRKKKQREKKLIAENLKDSIDEINGLLNKVTISSNDSDSNLFSLDNLCAVNSKLNKFKNNLDTTNTKKDKKISAKIHADANELMKNILSDIDEVISNVNLISGEDRGTLPIEEKEDDEEEDLALISNLNKMRFNSEDNPHLENKLHSANEINAANKQLELVANGIQKRINIMSQQLKKESFHSLKKVKFLQTAGTLFKTYNKENKLQSFIKARTQSKTKTPSL